MCFFFQTCVCTFHRVYTSSIWEFTVRKLNGNVIDTSVRYKFQCDAIVYYIHFETKVTDCYKGYVFVKRSRNLEPFCRSPYLVQNALKRVFPFDVVKMGISRMPDNVLIPIETVTLNCALVARDLEQFFENCRFFDTEAAQRVHDNMFLLLNQFSIPLGKIDREFYRSKCPNCLRQKYSDWLRAFVAKNEISWTHVYFALSMGKIITDRFDLFEHGSSIARRVVADIFHHFGSFIGENRLPTAVNYFHYECLMHDEFPVATGKYVLVTK